MEIFHPKNFCKEFYFHIHPPYEDDKGEAWRCFSAGFYRELECQGLSFSTDGSLMAIGFNSIITAWLPDSCELKCSLIHPNHRQTIKHLQFGNGNQCHLLVAGSSDQLSVWNLLTLSLVWTVPLQVSLLAADSLSTHMAVLTRNRKVFVFCPASQNPIYSSDELLSKQDEIVAATFIPSRYSNDTRLQWYERSHLYFIDTNNELYCVNNNNEDDSPQEEYYDDTTVTPFGKILPKSKASTVEAVAPSKHIYEKDVRHKNIKKYLEAPLHTMAPIRFSCGSLLKSLVLQKETVS